MLYFNNDYDQGTHPEILQRLTKINFDHQVCYGMDPHSKRAGELIANACGNKEAEVFFIAGGEDPVGNYGAGVRQTAEEFNKRGMDKVDVRIYPLCRHEILNELNRQEVYENIADWIGKVI